MGKEEDGEVVMGGMGGQSGVLRVWGVGVVGARSIFLDLGFFQKTETRPGGNLPGPPPRPKRRVEGKRVALRCPPFL